MFASLYLWCNASACSVLASVTACLGFTTAIIMYRRQHSAARETRRCSTNQKTPLPWGKDALLWLLWKDDGLKNSFESKYSSHSFAQKFNRITPMFYLTGFVVARRGDLLSRLLEKTLWFSTVPQGNLGEIAMLEILLLPCPSIFYHHLPFAHFSETPGGFSFA